MLPWLNRAGFAVFVLMVALAETAWSEYLLTSLKRTVVFPAQGLDENLVDDTWWQIREQLAADTRLTIASRRLMINRQVLSPRAELKPSDSVILGRILEADALIVTFIRDNSAHFIAYRAEDGITLYKDKIDLNPSTPVAEQALMAFQTLTGRYLRSIPYSGYQVPSPTTGNIIENYGADRVAYVELGKFSANVDEKVVWTRASNIRSPILQGDLKYQVIATGVVQQVLRGNVAQIKLDARSNEAVLLNNSLVYLSDRQEVGGDLAFEPRQSDLGVEFLLSDIQKPKQIQSQSKEATFLGFVFNAALLLLIGL